MALVALAITIYALIECVRTPSSEVRSLPKSGWVAAIILLPLIGAGLWFWLGRPKPVSDERPAQTRRATGAPDDDPEFLRNLEIQRRNKAREEEMRRKEAELKALESKLREDGKPGDENGKPRDEGGNPTEDTPRHTP